MKRSTSALLALVAWACTVGASPAIQWLEPLETPTGVMVNGFSPRITQAPGPIPRELLRGRQLSSIYIPDNWCGYVSGETDNVLSCSATLSCVFSGEAVGCCTGEISTCTALWTTCINDGVTCDTECEANINILKCNSARPYCNMNVWTAFDLTNWNCGQTSNVVNDVAAISDVLDSIASEDSSSLIFTSSVGPVVITASTESLTEIGSSPTSVPSVSGIAISQTTSDTTSSATAAATAAGAATTGSSASASTGSSSSHSGLSGGAIGGVVAGAVVGVGLIAGLAIYFCCCRGRRRNPDPVPPPPMEQQQQYPGTSQGGVPPYVPPPQAGGYFQQGAAEPNQPYLDGKPLEYPQQPVYGSEPPKTNYMAHTSPELGGTPVSPNPTNLSTISPMHTGTTELSGGQNPQVFEMGHQAGPVNEVYEMPSAEHR